MMKVIDLLNKIANVEEMPKKIVYDNTIYEYKEQYDYKNELQINYYSVDEGEDFFNNVFCYSLNDEIEIIEEDKKIEKIDQTLNRLDIGDDYYRYIMENRFKINEMIDYINKGEK